MTGYRRVREALEGRPPDRVPRGEFRMAGVLVRALLGGHARPLPAGGPGRWQAEEEALRLLGADMVGVPVPSLPPPGPRAVAAAWPPAGSAAGDSPPLIAPVEPAPHSSWIQEIAHWAGRDLFVWAVVDGPWQGLAGLLGWSQALLLLTGAHRRPRGDGSVSGLGDAGSELGEAGSSSGHVGSGLGDADSWWEDADSWLGDADTLLLVQLDRVLGQVAQALAAGADGIVMGEDLAYTGGLLLSPRVVRHRLRPLWAEVAARCRTARTARGDIPLLVFHSDGAVAPLLADIAAAGFHGLHSLEPEAGMDVTRLVGMWRGRLGLLGGLSVDLLSRGTPEAVVREAMRLARAARDGGLVVGTSSGLVPEGVSPANLVAAYRSLDTHAMRE